MDDPRIARIAKGISLTASRIYYPGCEGVIAQEVIVKGKSTGWNAQKQGDRTWKAAERAENALGPFNIGYVDDMNGEWGFDKGGSEFFQ